MTNFTQKESEEHVSNQFLPNTIGVHNHKKVIFY
jgi:hypothetical protein